MVSAINDFANPAKTSAYDFSWLAISRERNPRVGHATTAKRIQKAAPAV